MVNNPFRSKPSSNIQQNVEDWGKTKFKPNKFGGGCGGKKTFNKNRGGPGGGNKSFNRKFGNHKGNNSYKNKDNYKFNQVARDAKPENATPWNKYKDEIVFKQREEEQAALQANMDSSEAKNILKQREINYRKLLIEQKKQEPTQWEDFGEEEEMSRKNKNKFEQKIMQENNPENNPEKKLNSQSKKKFKKNVSNSVLKADVKEFISKELLENFDSKKLNYKQNDKLRGAITKTACLAKGGGSIEQVVSDMKRKKMKKEKLNKK